MIESIKKMLNNGATISVPYKNEINEWYSDIKILKSSKSTYNAHRKTFYDIDDAVNYFYEQAYTSKNKGYIQNRLVDKGLLDPDDEYSIEYPDKKMKKLFLDEGKLIDEEFKKLNIKLKEFPKLSDAKKEIKDVENFTNFNSLKKFIINFQKKYSMLDIYIRLSCNYQYENNNSTENYTTNGFKIENLNEKNIKAHKDVSMFNDHYKNIKFVNFNIIFSNNNEIYKYILKI